MYMASACGPGPASQLDRPWSLRRGLAQRPGQELQVPTSRAKLSRVDRTSKRLRIRVTSLWTVHDLLVASATARYPTTTDGNSFPRTLGHPSSRPFNPLLMPDRIRDQRYHRPEDASDISVNAVKQSTEGVAKGGIQAAEEVTHFQ